MDPVVHAAADPVDLLRREAAALVDRVRPWTAQRWAAAAPAGGSRADVAHHLAQSLADVAADLEGRPRRELPRLPSDLGLPDQLAVTADDLVRARPSRPVAVSVAAHLLLHREDLVGDGVPPGLAQALGLDDVVLAGRAACTW